MGPIDLNAQSRELARQITSLESKGKLNTAESNRLKRLKAEKARTDAEIAKGLTGGEKIKPPKGLEVEKEQPTYNQEEVRDAVKEAYEDCKDPKKTGLPVASCLEIETPVKLVENRVRKEHLEEQEKRAIEEAMDGQAETGKPRFHLDNDPPPKELITDEARKRYWERPINEIKDSPEKFKLPPLEE